MLTSAPASARTGRSVSWSAKPYPTTSAGVMTRPLRNSATGSSTGVTGGAGRQQRAGQGDAQHSQLRPASGARSDARTRRCRRRRRGRPWRRVFLRSRRPGRRTRPRPARSRPARYLRRTSRSAGGRTPACAAAPPAAHGLAGRCRSRRPRQWGRRDTEGADRGERRGQEDTGGRGGQRDRDTGDQRAEREEHLVGGGVEAVGPAQQVGPRDHRRPHRPPDHRSQRGRQTAGDRAQHGQPHRRRPRLAPASATTVRTSPYPWRAPAGPGRGRVGTPTGSDRREHRRRGSEARHRGARDGVGARGVLHEQQRGQARGALRQPPDEGCGQEGRDVRGPQEVPVRRRCGREAGHTGCRPAGQRSEQDPPPKTSAMNARCTSPPRSPVVPLSSATRATSAARPPAASARPTAPLAVAPQAAGQHEQRGDEDREHGEGDELMQHVVAGQGSRPLRGGTCADELGAVLAGQRDDHHRGTGEQTSPAPMRPAVPRLRRLQSARPAEIVPTARARKPPIITAADGDVVAASALIPRAAGHTRDPVPGHHRGDGEDFDADAGDHGPGGPHALVAERPGGGGTGGAARWFCMVVLRMSWCGQAMAGEPRGRSCPGPAAAPARRRRPCGGGSRGGQIADHAADGR